MKRLAWMGVVVWACMVVTGLKEASGAEQASTKVLMGAFLVKTNAQGGVDSISLESLGGGTYKVMPDGLPADVMQFDGRSVEAKGEILQKDGALWFKVTGGIKTKTTTLIGGAFQVWTNTEGQASQVMLHTPDAGGYYVVMDSIPKDFTKFCALKTVYGFTSRVVDVDGEILWVKGQQVLKITRIKDHGKDAPKDMKKAKKK